MCGLSSAVNAGQRSVLVSTQWFVPGHAIGLVWNLILSCFKGGILIELYSRKPVLGRDYYRLGSFLVKSFVLKNKKVARLSFLKRIRMKTGGLPFLIK